MKKLLPIVLCLAIFAGALGISTAGQYDAYKPNYKAPRWDVTLNAFIDQVSILYDYAHTTLADMVSNLSALVTNWVTTENYLIYCTATPTYTDGDTFTVPGDLTSSFPAGRVIQADNGTTDGVIVTTVASSSYAGGETTVELSASVLTANLARIFFVASRDGLTVAQSGQVFATDYGSPGQTTLENAIAAIGASTRVLKLGPGTWAIATDVTVPANVVIDPQPGALIEIADGAKLTANIVLNPHYQCFVDNNTDLDGVKLLGVTEIPPECWGAVRDGATDDTAAVQAAINCAMYSDHAKFVRLGTGSYAVTGLSATNTGIAIAGYGKYKSKLVPTSTSPALTISGAGFTLRDFGIFSDRAATRRGVRIYHASVVTKWPVIQNLHFEQLAGYAIKLDGLYCYEFTLNNISAPICGDNTTNGSVDEAVIEFDGGASSDYNNINVQNCVINSFWGPAIRVNNIAEPAGGTTPGLRQLRIDNCMFHAGTSYVDLTPQPVNSIDLNGVSDVFLRGSRFALVSDAHNAVKVDKGSGCTQKSQRITVRDNTFAGPVNLINVQEGYLDRNLWLFAAGGTYTYHSVIASTCQYVKFEKQRVTTGASFVADDRGTSTTMTDGINTISHFWGPGGCKSTGGYVTIANPNTTATVTLGTAEANANYNVVLTPTFNSTAYATSKSAAGFTVNVGTSPATTGYVFWYIYR